MKLGYECSQCGSANVFTVQPDDSFASAVRLAENDHARQHPECPWSRPRIFFSLDATLEAR